jgi:hypothetical protein
MTRALAQKPHELRVELVNRLAMSGNVHQRQNAELNGKNQVKPN